MEIFLNEKCLAGECDMDVGAPTGGDSTEDIGEKSLLQLGMRGKKRKIQSCMIEKLRNAKRWRLVFGKAYVTRRLLFCFPLSLMALILIHCNYGRNVDHIFTDCSTSKTSDRTVSSASIFGLTY